MKNYGMMPKINELVAKSAALEMTMCPDSELSKRAYALNTEMRKALLALVTDIQARDAESEQDRQTWQREYDNLRKDFREYREKHPELSVPVDGIVTKDGGLR